jgi:hypothetical protein
MPIESHSHIGGPDNARYVLNKYPVGEELVSQLAPKTLVENLGLETSFKYPLTVDDGSGKPEDRYIPWEMSKTIVIQIFINLFLFLNSLFSKLELGRSKNEVINPGNKISNKGGRVTCIL